MWYSVFIDYLRQVVRQHFKANLPLITDKLEISYTTYHFFINAAEF